MNKKLIVIHSGGMDSSICLALALEQYSTQEILSLSFDYGQRNRTELLAAEKICADWKVDHQVIVVPCLSSMTHNAMLSHDTPIKHEAGKAPNTLVVGRNGLFVRLAAIYAHQLKALAVMTGVLEIENSNYRDCSREYMDLMEKILRMDLGQETFQILTPLITMTKLETHQVAERLGVLNYLLEETISCYEGLKRPGCGLCPACELHPHHKTQ